MALISTLVAHSPFMTSHSGQQPTPQLARRYISLTNELPNQEGPSVKPSSRPKPDLKRAGRFGSSKITVAACILAAIYMYPMIFMPMFGLGTPAEDKSDQLRRSGVDPSKTRPSFMPEWSNPFGPRKGDRLD